MEGRFTKLWGKLVMPVALAVLMGISCINAYAYDSDFGELTLELEENDLEDLAEREGLGEESEVYEEDESGYNFNWINEEYYYDTSEEWIVYVSHEGTITFCGDKLMSIAEQVIPGEYRYLNKDDEDERD